MLAKAGIQGILKTLDSRLRGNDGVRSKKTVFATAPDLVNPAILSKKE